MLCIVAGPAAQPRPAALRRQQICQSCWSPARQVLHGLLHVGVRQQAPVLMRFCSCRQPPDDVLHT
jgi:hypothetical protein